MGAKPSNNFQSDRPESGGADHDSARENSGLLDNNKQKYAADRADVTELFDENRPRKPVIETPRAPDQSEPDGPNAPNQAAPKPDSLGG